MSVNEVDFGVPSYETLGALSGLEFLKRVCEGRLPQAPIAETLDFRMIEADDGLAIFEGTPSFALYNPMGSVHAGWYGTLLDSCMSCAVHTTHGTTTCMIMPLPEAAAA